jgi:hypothetical protein
MGGWTPERGGVFKARLFAIRDIIREKIDDLNAAFAADSTLSYLVGSTFGGSLAETIVERGDTYEMWARNTGCLRIAVCAGDHRDGMTGAVDRQFIDVSATHGHRLQVFTSIYFYFHKDAFGNADAPEQAGVREDAREQVNDWLLFDVFMHPDNLAIELTSQCFNTDEGDDQLKIGQDVLDFCLAENIYKGVFIRGNSNIELYGGHVRHHAQIE